MRDRSYDKIFYDKACYAVGNVILLIWHAVGNLIL